MPTEDQEQTWLIQHLQLRQLPHFRVPNETYTKSWAQKRKNKRLGVQAGIPDLFVLVAGRVIGIEMKRQKGGIVTKEQRKWIAQLSEYGIETRVCRGYLEAKEFIREVEMASAYQF